MSVCRAHGFLMELWKSLDSPVYLSIPSDVTSDGILAAGIDVHFTS